jgi:exopolysaccharide biosynthesis polyprenyl glycosylphosphotransferase
MGFIDASGRGSPRPRLRSRHLAVDPQSAPVPVLGGLEHLEKLVRRTRATDLVVAVRDQPGNHLGPHLLQFSRSDVKVHWVRVERRARPRPEQRVPPERREEYLRIDLPHNGQPSQWGRRAINWPRAGKRLLDIVGAGLGLIALAPLFAVVAVGILLSSGRPIFYSQERVGQRGRRFRIVKFRSMRTDAEQETGPIWASDHDSRCTRIGDWLRHSNIDELPQLFNVLVGNMSLVGPRPERPVFVEQFCHEMQDYDLRHAVPCGMTGWAQVHGWRGRTSLRKRVQYDLDYIERWSFWLDLRILLMTIQHVAWGKTSWNLSRTACRIGR